MSKTERDIVEALAVCEEPLGEDNYGYTYCVLCNVDRPQEEHKPDCPWRMAVEHIKARDAHR